MQTKIKKRTKTRLKLHQNSLYLQQILPSKDDVLHLVCHFSQFLTQKREIEFDNST